MKAYQITLKIIDSSSHDVPIIPMDIVSYSH